MTMDKAEIVDLSYSAGLAAKLSDSLRQLSRGAQSWALLDFPGHDNIGDSAIWIGEMALLKPIHGTSPQMVGHLRLPRGQTNQVFGQTDETGIIYLHGGGNFGDIWPRFQKYREDVITANPRHRIVQLPQSIHFDEATAIERTRRTIGEHRNFHLMVRDEESANFARTHFDCEIILAPDSAFGIDMTDIPRNPAPRGILAHFRGDKEQRADAAAGRGLFADATIQDWPPEGQIPRLSQKAILGTLLATPPALSRLWGERSLTALARWRIMRGFALLGTAEVVVTDRLHGHIMATLLDKPHVVIDNYYGKISRFIGAWGQSSDTLVARDFAEARIMADNLLAQVRANSFDSAPVIPQHADSLA